MSVMAALTCHLTGQGARRAYADPIRTTAKLSQELSHNPRPWRESNGHVGNENPHHGVKLLPYVVVWLAFKSLGLPLFATTWFVPFDEHCGMRVEG